MLLYYLSTSKLTGITPNSLQVYNMCKSFSKENITVKLFCKEYNGVLKQNERLYIKKNFSRFHQLYLIILLFKALTNKNKVDVFFTRNIILAVVLQKIITTKPVIYECHSLPRGKFKTKILEKINNSNFWIISISNKLKEDLHKLTNAQIIVLPDAHGFDLNSPFQYQAVSNKIKIGYFGSIKKQKGEFFLKEIINNNPNIDFYLYSKDIKSSFNNPNIKEYKFLKQEECFKEMKKMDALLLFIEPQLQDVNDISPYTSPLKLFEYAAARKPIIASDLPIVREILNDNNSFLINHNLEQFNSAVSLLKNKELVNEKVTNAFELAKKYTWDNRVKKIISIIKTKK